MLRILAMASLAYKRTLSHLALLSTTLLGLIVAVTFVTSVPLYSNAVNERLLHEQFAKPKSNTIRPQPSLMYRYLGSNSGYIPFATFQKVDAYLTQQTDPLLGLPSVSRMTHVRTNKIDVMPMALSVGGEPVKLIRQGYLGYVTNLEENVTLVDGRLPEAGTVPQDDIEVMVTEAATRQSGAQVAVGDRYRIWAPDREKNPIQVTVRISGVWRANNEKSGFWVYPPDRFDDVLLMHPDSFATQLMPRYQDEVFEAVWYMRFDGQQIHSTNALRVLGGVQRLTAKATTLLGALRLEDSPSVQLEDYWQNSRLMSILLYVFGAPIIAVVLYFIIVSSSMVVERQRDEISVLKSRGAGTGQVVTLYLMQGILVGLGALAVSPFIATQVAQLIGRTYTFLLFVNREPLPVALTPDAYQTAVAAVGVSVLATVLPVIGVARYSVVSYRQEISRGTRRPWWQRFYFDVLLLAISVYGHFMLSGQGNLLATDLASGGDPFKNPLLLVVPALMIFAIGLLFVRMFPWFVALLAWLTHFLPGVPLLLGLRQIARAPGQYGSLALLITLTVGLGTFSASVAKTLDRNYADQIYYQTGSDLQLAEIGDFNPFEGFWRFVPVSTHLTVPGVRSAARVGKFDASVPGNRAFRSGDKFTLIGVDREDFLPTARVAWRRDYAPNTLGTLMNELGAKEDNLIVDRTLLGKLSLQVGDKIEISAFGARIPFTIADVVDYFPTMNPLKERFVVGNMEYIFDTLGQPELYDVWVTYDHKVSPESLVKQFQDRDLAVSDYVDAVGVVEKQRRDPSRTGLFGILSVGFIVAAGLTVAGFLFHSFLSLQRRFIQLGVLRAIGLSVGQLVRLVFSEQLLVMTIATLVGTAAGIQTGNMFIPFMQIGAEKATQVPPFVVVTAWDEMLKIYVILAAMFVVGMLGIGVMLARMRVHEAVKLGGLIE